MTEVSSDRKQLSASLEDIRVKISERKLCLFLGEQNSVLPGQTLEEIIELVKKSAIKEIIGHVDALERKATEDQYRTQSILRTVGRFPIIMTVCIDQLTEKKLFRKEDKIEKIRLDNVTEDNEFASWSCHERTLLIKCLGDTSFHPSLKPTVSSCTVFESLSRMDSTVSTFLENIFNEKSFLFLGFDRNNSISAGFLEKIVKPSKVPHYLFEHGKTTECNVLENLTILKANTSLPEFVQYLSPGTVRQLPQEPLKGEVLEISFLPTQRSQYLLQQLYMEKESTEIGIQTVKITNALSTDELLETESRPTIRKIFQDDPFMGQWDEAAVDKVMSAMKDRRDNLYHLSSATDTKVTAIFSFQAFLNEVEPRKGKSDNDRKMAIRKYATVILNSRSDLHSTYNLWLRVIPDKLEDAEKILLEKFGIFRLEGGQDEGIAYAEPAIKGKKVYSSHFISVNGPEVLRKRRIFEENLCLAWSHEKTVLEMTVALLKENLTLRTLSDEQVRTLESLRNVQLLTEMNLLPGSFERISEGSFGEVFRAKWNNNGQYQDVAVKIIKKISSTKDLDDYWKEFDSMRKAKHPNIVEVYKPYRKNHQLGLIMEYMEGGSIRDLLNETPSVGQSKKLTELCAMQVASALSFLHGKKILHRDIKVDNVFLSADKQTFKIGDFGLARLEASTRITKTQDAGSFRYMAPEVARGLAMGKYSTKADVYSYGLMLFEIMAGDLVFKDIPIHQDVYKLRVSGQLAVEIPDNFKDEHGSVLTSIVEQCVQNDADARPTIQNVVDMLQGKPFETPNKGIGLLCLGTGTGSTAVIHGEPSSSFVVFDHEEPLLLVDFGLGVMLPYRSALGNKLPLNIFLTHNHSDHTGNLPVFFGVITPTLLKNKQRVNILSGPEPMYRIKTHRMHEILSQLETMTNTTDLDLIANWIVCEPNQTDRTYLDKEKQFYVQIVKSQHAEICYGLVLFYQDRAILGYSSDSGFNQELYDIIYQADTVIVDARKSSSYEHASFEEVSKFTELKQHSRVFIIGYGARHEAPTPQDYRNITALQPGKYYPLNMKKSQLQQELTVTHSAEYPNIHDAV